MLKAQHVCRVGAVLGEGPVWDSREGALWFVDIKSRRIHLYHPGAALAAAWDVPAQVGWVLPAQGGRLLAGLQGGIYRFDPTGGVLSCVVPVESDRPGNRLNDATVAPDGAIWFGSMDDGEARATGQVYRFDGCSVETTSISPVPITNGPAVSPDGRTLYHVDTAGGVVYAVALEDGVSVGAAREFVRLDPAEGHPDGPTVDAQGRIWLGVWGGSQVRCYDPDGRLAAVVALPVANVTKVAFGGPDLRTVYVTTARAGLTESELWAQPLAGDLFAFEADAPGQPIPLARLSA